MSNGKGVDSSKVFGDDTVINFLTTWVCVWSRWGSNYASDLSICTDLPHPLLLLSLRSTTRQPRKIANIQITVSPPATAEKPAHSLALTDSRSRLLTRLRAHALRLRSTVTVSARTQVHALQVQVQVQVPGRGATRLPVRRGDGLAAALVQRRGRNGQPAVCTAEDPVHGNASTLAVISKAVSAFLTDWPLTLRVSFFFLS
jgi:hypothetical protein